MGLEVIDLTPCTDDAAAASAVEQRLLRQLEHHGFLYVTSRELQDGAACGILQTAQLAGEQFFRQPLEVKMQAVSRDRARRGYSPAMSENYYSLLLTTDSSSGGGGGKNTRSNDDVEKLRFGPVAAIDEAGGDYYTSREGRVFFFPNTYDGSPQGFREATEACYALMAQLSLALLAAIEGGLGLQQGFFQRKMQDHTSILTYNYYGAQQSSSASSLCDDGKAYRIAEHTDVSMLTLVHQSELSAEEGGLEILSRAGGWVHVPYVRGAVVVNVGDCLQDWTGGRLRSTQHRVRVRPGGADERLSIAYFVSPNYRACLDWPPDGVGAERGRSYSLWRQRRVKRALAKQLGPKNTAPREIVSGKGF